MFSILGRKNKSVDKISLPEHSEVILTLKTKAEKRQRERTEKEKRKIKFEKRASFKKIWEGTLMPSLFDSFLQCLGRGKGFSSPVGRKTRAGGHEHKPRGG